MTTPPPMAQSQDRPWASPPSTVALDAGVVRAQSARLRVGAWVIALMMGFIQAWRSRHAMNPDGVSYLDISDAYLAGDWSAAINAYWSPLYSWLLAGATLLFRPPPYWEVTVVHLVNFAIYALSLAAFEFLLTELLRSGRTSDVPEPGVANDGNEWAWRLLGYSLFVWAALGTIGLAAVTPDMSVAALMYLAGGILLRLRDPKAAWWFPIVLGVTLGLGFLAKAAMLPLAIVFIAAGVISWRVPRRTAVTRVLMAAAGFGIVAAPFVLALSRAHGSPTWGAVARVAYVWCIDGAIPSTHCTEPPEGYSVVDATRKISDAPAIYEFGTPIAGSYPPWYDPSYWYEGVHPRMRPVRMLSRLLVHSLEYLRLLAAIVAVFGVLWWSCGRPAPAFGGLRRFAPLTVPAAAALLMYGLVHIQPRYLGPFAVLLSLGAFRGLPLAQARIGNTMLAGASVSLAGLLVGPLGVALLMNAAVMVVRSDSGAATRHIQWEVAEALRGSGLREGDAVAVLGGELAPYWARLARIRIVSELPTSQAANWFWAADSSARARATALLAGTGAQTIVAKSMPPWARGDSWRALGRTGYYLLSLRP